MSEPPRGGRTKRVVAPKGPGRRSQAERAQRQQEERERTRLRDEEYSREMKAAKAAQEKADRLKQQRSQAANRRGRGGFMGDTTVRAGPLSAGSVITPRRRETFPRHWAPGRRGRTGTARTFTVKREGEESKAGPSAPDPDPRLASDDEEEDDGEGPRVDIDQIDFVVISDDDEAAEDGQQPRQAFNFTPVRVDRVEHLDRKPQLNPDGSSTVKKQEADEGDLSSVPTSLNRKGKQRTKDVQIISSEERWRPVYDDDDDEVTMVKQEEPTSLPLPAIPRPSESLPEATLDEGEKSVKSRARRRPAQGNTRFQTKEEVEEYERHQQGLQTMFDEFGHISMEDDPPGENTETGGQEPQVDKKADRVYLFQFPPVVPDLIDANQKAVDTLEVTKAGAASQGVKPTVEGQVVDETPVKEEPDRSKPDMSERPAHLPKLEAGFVGKFKVYKSGKTAFDWGGLPLQVQMGITPFFLQDVVMTQLNNAAPDQPTAQQSTSTRTGSTASNGKRAPDPIAGEAMAFGQVRGKLVVTPNWDELLGRLSHMTL